MVLDGKYELTELVGEGTMGWVYRAVHRSLESTIAVKLMKPSPQEDDTRDQRFQREARAASRLNNPHIISIIDFGRTAGGLLYIVSEFLRGANLSELVELEERLDLERAIRIMDQVLSAVDEAHEVGLVHRDLKPENIVITPLRSGEDFVKVLDFGIAKLADAGDRKLTLAGQLFGTPTYMAPEQIRGQEATARSDLYACGLILQEMLTGEEVFSSQSVMEVLAAQLGQEPTPLRQAAPDRDLPEALEAVVARCLAKDPAERYESAHSLRKAMHRAVGFRKGYTTPTDEAATVRCGGCGALLAAAGRFCPDCGAPLAATGSPSAAPPRPGREQGDTLRWAGRAATLQAPRVEPLPDDDALARSLPDDALARSLSDDALATSLPDDALATSLPDDALATSLPDDVLATSLPDDALVEPLLDDGAPVEGFERQSSDAYLSAHSTLNRRLRAEQTLRFELVDRESEIHRLSRLLQTGWGTAEILGPLGSGRSRILSALAPMAREQRLTVVQVGAEPRLSRTPWYPIQRVVSEVLGLDLTAHDLDFETLRQRTREAGLLEDDVLGLAGLFHLPHPGGPVELAVRRRETRSAALRALTRSRVASQGLCLLFDDADEYDAASQAFLRELLALEEPIGPRCVVLSGERSVLLDTNADLVVEPTGFGVTEIEQLMRQALDVQGCSWPELLQTITTRSRGNPMHAAQAVRLLVEGGTEVDQSLPDLMQTRIGRVPSDALRLLQMICILGREARRDHVKSLYEDDALFDRALQLLFRRGFVASVDDERLRVEHRSIADTVREMMPADARQQLHRKALALLRDAGEDPIFLARHAAEARDGETSLAVLRQAGLSSEKRLDDHGAARHYRRALHMARWELLYEEHDEQCLSLALHLGDTLHFTGELQAAELVLKESLPAARALPAFQAKLLRSLGRVKISQGDVEPGLGCYREALRQGLMAGERDLLAELYVNLGKTLSDLERFGEAVQEMREGVDLVTAGEGAGAADVPVGFWRLLLQLAEAERHTGDFVGATRHAAVALDQARREESLVGQARCHSSLAQILEDQHRVEAAERHHAAALETFRQLGDRQSAAECLLSRASRCPDRSQDLIQQALTLSRQVAWNEGILAASSLLAAS